MIVKQVRGRPCNRRFNRASCGLCGSSARRGYEPDPGGRDASRLEALSVKLRRLGRNVSVIPETGKKTDVKALSSGCSLTGDSLFLNNRRSSGSPPLIESDVDKSRDA